MMLQFGFCIQSPWAHTRATGFDANVQSTVASRVAVFVICTMRKYATPVLAGGTSLCDPCAMRVRRGPGVGVGVGLVGEPPPPHPLKETIKPAATARDADRAFHHKPGTGLSLRR